MKKILNNLKYFYYRFLFNRLEKKYNRFLKNLDGMYAYQKIILSKQEELANYMGQYSSEYLIWPLAKKICKDSVFYQENVFDEINPYHINEE